MEPLYVIKNEDAALHLSKGNSKIGKGIWSFSTLPGNKENLLTINKTTLLTNVSGTCSKYCNDCFNGGCYAVNSAKLHHNAVIRAWAENTILLRSGRLFKEIHQFIEKKNARFYKTRDEKDIIIKTFRINVSGEIESSEEFASWNNLAATHPEITFSVYTKNYDDLRIFLKKNVRNKNFIINTSQWHGVADEFLKEYAGQINVFEYDDSNLKNNTLTEEDKKRLAKTPHCPAVTVSGRHAKDANGDPITCDHCMRCYRDHGGVTAVYAH